jgi:sodium transport system ATP-binding protein
MLYGLMKPDSGQVAVDGINTAVDPLAAQSCMGVLPDSHGLYPRLTAREHIRYFGQLQAVEPAVLERRTDELIQQLDMGGIADRRAEGFSHGERMKVSLGRALVHDPGTVLLDEPTNGLDVQSTRAVRGLIRQMRADGRCVLFSSHIMQEVSALCDRIVIIAAGRIAAVGTPEQITQQTGHDNLEDAFVALSGLNEVQV